MIIDPANAPVSGEAGLSTLHLSVAGGITQFGTYIDTLQPGAFSSHRHWHTAEDEFIYVLDGTVTLRDDDGMHDLAPGDAAAWPHGCPNAHHLTNRGDTPCRYIIIGSRAAGDVCHYPDDGRMQVNGSTRWHMEDATGAILRQSDLPPELLNLPQPWGDAFNPNAPGQRILHQDTTPWTPEENPVHPVTGPGPGPYSARLLSDPGGLTQFGAFLEDLPPGSSSGHRHWHEAEDEMVFMLSGEAVLVDENETTLHPGDAAAWPAGVPIGHRLDNRADAPVRYLVIGTRAERDIIHYTDHDLITHKDGPTRRYLRRDGSEYLVRRQP